MKNRNVNIIRDIDDNKIVVIHDIRFKGKRHIDWDDVEKYLKQYIGEFYEIAESSDIVHIGNELADEFIGSKDTVRLKGALAKAKANAASGVPELVEIASNKYLKFRYDSRFALPVYDDAGEVERYNVFHVEMLIRHDTIPIDKP